MKTRSLFGSLVVCLTLPLTLTGCPSGGVGDPCIPEDEYRKEFPGFAYTEVNVESRSFQCLTRVCLVNKFQGRVSCPYGQDHTSRDPETLAVVAHTQQCIVPGTVDTQVEQVVRPQLVDRLAADTVYCSCRCAGAGAANYCSCPSGFQCEELIDDLGLGSDQLAGSYCVRTNTAIDDAGKYKHSGDALDTNTVCTWVDAPGSPAGEGMATDTSSDCGELGPY